MNFLRTRQWSFRYALDGLAHVIRTQQNAWVHLTISTFVVIVAIWLGLDRIEWAILMLIIGLVWMAEFLNTALEVIVDLASPEKHPLAKIGKDVGAAAVLITAMVSVVIGVLILGPHLLEKLGF
ncbi:MAG: diacylglycerol kinase family protein [Chloroflexi bacterium]|nr:diacylglycerol kinase family protein [Chloroflexota bacterium]